MSEATISDKADMISKRLGEFCNILKDPPEACNKDCTTCRAGFAIFAFGSLLADVAEQKAELAEANRKIELLKNQIVSIVRIRKMSAYGKGGKVMNKYYWYCLGYVAGALTGAGMVYFLM